MDAAPDGLHLRRGPARRGYDEPTGLPVLPGARRCRTTRAWSSPGATLVYAVLNLYPYNPGHLMVCPYRHVADYTDLDRGGDGGAGDVHPDRDAGDPRGPAAPHGFNLGMNQGAVAGAGIAAHLHQHVVPRWGGDTNFMPVDRPDEGAAAAARRHPEAARLRLGQLGRSGQVRHGLEAGVVGAASPSPCRSARRGGGRRGRRRRRWRRRRRSAGSARRRCSRGRRARRRRAAPRRAGRPRTRAAPPATTARGRPVVGAVALRQRHRDVRVEPRPAHRPQRPLRRARGHGVAAGSWPQDGPLRLAVLLPQRVDGGDEVEGVAGAGGLVGGELDGADPRSTPSSPSSQSRARNVTCPRTVSGSCGTPGGGRRRRSRQSSSRLEPKRSSRQVELRAGDLDRRGERDMVRLAGWCGTPLGVRGGREGTPAGGAARSSALPAAETTSACRRLRARAELPGQVLVDGR